MNHFLMISMVDYAILQQVEQEIADKKANKKPFMVKRRPGTKSQKKVDVDVSTELNQLSVQDCFDYIAAVAKLHMI